MGRVILAILWLLTETVIGQVGGEAAFSKSYSFEYESNYTKAIAALNEANQETYQVNLRLGWLQYLNKDYVKSEKHYRKAVQLESQSIEARFGLALPLSAVGNFNTVADLYREILRIDPNNSIASYRLALLLYNTKDFDGSAKLVSKVIRMYPFDYDSNLLFGKILIAQKKTAESKKYLEKSLQYNPQSDEVKVLLKSIH
jgi:tetratricopeptide (TPR) repeat protein